MRRIKKKLGKLIIKAGTRFSDWLVIEDVFYGDAYAMCRCVCGREKLVNAYVLRNGKSKSCGCKRKKVIIKKKYQRYPKRPRGLKIPKDKRFTGLLTLEDAYYGDGHIMCRCVCGREILVKCSYLLAGSIRWCGECGLHVKWKFESLEGRIYGSWNVIADDGGIKVKCQCINCGEIKEINRASLKNGTSASCGNEKKCEACGNVFPTKSKSARFCPDCRNKIKNVSGNSFTINGKKFYKRYMPTLPGQIRKTSAEGKGIFTYGNKYKVQTMLSGKILYFGIFNSWEQAESIVAEYDRLRIKYVNSDNTGKDLTGRVHGSILPICYTGEQGSDGSNMWLIFCRSCKKFSVMSTKEIKRYMSCGCRKHAPKDISGKKFPHFKAIRPTGDKKGTQSMWLCQCECGNLFEASISNIMRGDTKSCGCLHKKVATEQITKDVIDGTKIGAIKSRTRSNNSSGHKGVSWDKRQEKWYAYITFQKKMRSLGMYDRMEDAIAAREAAEDELFQPILNKWEAEKGRP